MQNLLLSHVHLRETWKVKKDGDYGRTYFIQCAVFFFLPHSQMLFRGRKPVVYSAQVHFCISENDGLGILPSFGLWKKSESGKSLLILCTNVE